MSMARALNRKMARISLGGVHDEADIRGHRKTYVGAMPGRIINAVRQAGTRNPLLLLDEIDKLGSDMRGDPAAALLEVLDGEQNSTFRDHFLELPFDLSEVLFITTANTTSTIPKPLLDRMEVIELPSYTDEEKLQIAKQHLLPKQLKRHGLKKNQLKITDDAIREVIVAYTRESGVRVLERELGALCRKAAMGIVIPCGISSAHVTGDTLEEFLGVPESSIQRRMAWRTRWGWSTAWPGPPWAGDPVGGGGQRGARLRQSGAHRQPGQCDEGVSPGGLHLYPQPGGPAGGGAQLLQGTKTFTSTSPRAQCPRTAPPPE